MRYMINAMNKENGWMEDRFGATTVELAGTKKQAMKKAETIRAIHSDWTVYIVDSKTMEFVY